MNRFQLKLEEQLMDMKRKINYLTEADEVDLASIDGGDFLDEPQNAELPDGSTVDAASEETTPVEDTTSDGAIEIDVSSIVNQSKDNAVKIDSVIDNMNSKFDQLTSLISQMSDEVESKVQSVKDKVSNEFKKANPTPKHKLKLRSLDAAPFTIGIEDVLANTADNYEVENMNRQVDGTELSSYGGTKSDCCNDGCGGKKDYTLTDVDVNNSYSESEVAASFTWHPYNF